MLFFVFNLTLNLTSFLCLHFRSILRYRFHFYIKYYEWTRLPFSSLILENYNLKICGGAHLKKFMCSNLFDIDYFAYFDVGNRIRRSLQLNIV